MSTRQNTANHLNARSIVPYRCSLANHGQRFLATGDRPPIQARKTLRPAQLIIHHVGHVPLKPQLLS